MRRFLNKQNACGFTFIATVIFFTFLPLSVFGQDTTSLQNVEIVAAKEELSQLGKKKEIIDSTIKEQFRFGSIGDVLSYNSAVYIKSYGPGGLSTTAFRGGNAEQTAVLWNGFNIQNYMLGQADLSLLPSVLFEQIGIEYGGSSALWGSGAVGGSIHLDSKSPFNKGLKSIVNVGGGSFGMYNSSAQVLYSKKRFVSSTKIYLNNSDNNFKYRDTSDHQQPLKRQRNAEYNFKGFMQELKFIVNSKQMVSLNIWANDNHRRLPNFNPLAESKTYQQDQALRSSVNWTYAKQKFRTNIRAGFFHERINYNDSIARIFSENKVQTFIADNENYFNWGFKNVFSIGASVLSTTGRSDNYGSAKNISRVSLLAGNKFSFLNNKLRSYVSARLEYFSVGTLPVTGNISLEYELLKDLVVSANAAKIYRQPTLNELFWKPGGNENLKAEEGYTYEGNLKFRKQIRKVLVGVSGSVYSRKIENWILWVPGMGGNPAPVNIQNVWSRGAETNWKADYSHKKFRTGIRLGSSYVLSTTESTLLENSDNVGRQLIYTPRYNFNGHMSVGYNQWECIYFHQYVGYRFTAGDNSQWLMPYQLSSIKLNYKFIFPRLNLVVFTGCNNLFNSNYQVVAGRPMPLINFEFGISIQTK
ncbi:MAG: TonB-dependent receptor [Bacteroidia bacterium]|nr:TonB-dependent receptor [Bacteroidia bacterium]